MGYSIHEIIQMHNLPIVCGNQEMHEFLKKYYDDYLLKLASATSNNSSTDFSPNLYNKLKTDIVPKIETICEMILETLEYERSHNQIETRRCFFNLMSLLNENGALRIISILDEGVMVRIRQGKESFCRKDLFHIPYHKRHLASAQRFSIPGKPCLYLSFYPGMRLFADDMLTLSWLESGMPREYSACLFESQEELTFLHLGKKGNTYLKEYDEAETPEIKKDRQSAIMQYLISFPLRAACFIGIEDKAYKKATHFHNEYIIPQLLMEWVQSSSWSGIVYQSASAISHVSKQKSYNIAIPIKNIDPIDGYDIDLKRAFKLSEPIKINIVDKVANLKDDIKKVFDYAQRVETKIQLSKASERHPYYHLLEICYSFISACSALLNDSNSTVEMFFHQVNGFGNMALLINKTIAGVQTAEEWVATYKGYTGDTSLSPNDYDDILLGFGQVNLVIQKVRVSLYPKIMHNHIFTKPAYESL